jgi:signal transduction histidine kinase
MALPGDYEGCLIEFEADIVAVDRSADDSVVLTLSAGKTSVAAVCRLHVFARMKRVSAGSRVAVTGIAQSIPSKTTAGAVDRMALLLRSTADVRVLRTPPWWTPRRLGIALGSTLAALTAVGVAAATWITVLRWRVAAQLRVIEQNLEATAVAEERRRIAREFHDSLDQGLAALSLRLGAAARQTEDEATRAVVLQQRRFLGSLQKEARDFLWDLRYPTHVAGSLRESIWTQLIHLGAHTSVPLEMETQGEPADLPPLVHYQLVRIVREAVNNAIKYAHASHIVVRLEASRPTEGGTLRLEVRDDGQGFDVSTRAELEGHFGIRGMQERARQIGADLAIESGPGRGTILSVTLPHAERPGRPAEVLANVAG